MKYFCDTELSVNFSKIYVLINKFGFSIINLLY